MYLTVSCRPFDPIPLINNLFRRASEITIWLWNALSTEVCITSPQCEDFRRAGANIGAVQNFEYRPP